MNAAAPSPQISSLAGTATPPFMAVFSEQLGLIGRALWREAVIFAVLFVAFFALAVYEIFAHRMQVDFPIAFGPFIALFSLLMAFAVWRGEKLFDSGHLLTLPVDRRNHLLIRSLAGGVWLAGALAWAMLWLALMGLISGGDLGFDRYLLVGAPGPDGLIPLDSVRTIRWTPSTWHWLSAFTTGAVFYLIGCAMAVGVRRRLPWAAAGVALGSLFAANPFDLAKRLGDILVSGPVGLDNLMTGGMNRTENAITLADGTRSIAWTQMPDPLAWATAATAWLALGLALLWLAASRHRER